MTTFNFGVLADVWFDTVNTEDGPVECENVVFFIGASTPEGRNYVLRDGLPGRTVDAYMTEAEALADIAAIDHNPETAPDMWNEVEPTYGSEAWGPENEYELACFEADCFGEPRPRWF